MAVSSEPNISVIAKARHQECAVEALAYEIRLRFFKNLNIFTVVLPSVMSVLAGSALISTWADSVVALKMGIAIATLLSAVLVAIHRSLKCDTYQEDAGRLIREFTGLGIKYRTLSEGRPEDEKDQFFKYEDELAKLRGTVVAQIPSRFRGEARRKLGLTASAKA